MKVQLVMELEFFYVQNSSGNTQHIVAFHSSGTKRATQIEN